MLVKTIKDYTDKETKVVYRVTDNSTIREVSDERGAELIAKGVVVEVKSEAKPKPSKKEKKKTEETTPDVDSENKEDASEETTETNEDSE